MTLVKPLNAGGGYTAEPTILNRVDAMSFRKKWIEEQKTSEFLCLDAVEDFLALRGLGDQANEIRTPRDSNRKKIKIYDYYGRGGQTIKKGLLIQLLHEHNLWTVYADQYWPFRKCSTVKRYLKKAAEWNQKN